MLIIASYTLINSHKFNGHKNIIMISIWLVYLLRWAPPHSILYLKITGFFLAMLLSFALNWFSIQCILKFLYVVEFLTGELS